jgi:hypothetical protein
MPNILVNETLKVNAALLTLREKWGFPTSLIGACGHGSFSLYTLLSQKGIKINCWWGTVRDFSHCWCEAGGVIYDPTATQVNLPLINDGLLYKPIHPVTDIADFFDFWVPPTKQDIRTIVSLAKRIKISK